jgi:RNA polymerase sigma factor (sigma-70 family)
LLLALRAASARGAAPQSRPLDLARASAPTLASLREEAWLLLNLALRRYLRAHSAGYRVTPEDLEDIAATKSLELIRRAEESGWDVSGREAAEVASYVSTVAKHGLVDLFRTEKTIDRQVGEDAEGRMDADALRRASRAPAAGEAAAERAEFVTALRESIAALKPRDRRIWFFRVFHEMATKEISSHPDVRLRPGHVDVILQRCRDAIRATMEARGFEPREMPPGTFAMLWETMHADRSLMPSSADPRDEARRDEAEGATSHD